MGPHIRGAEAPSGGDPLLGIIKFLFLMIHLKISNRNIDSNSCSGYHIELTAIIGKP